VEKQSVADNEECSANKSVRGSSTWQGIVVNTCCVSTVASGTSCCNIVKLREHPKAFFTKFSSERFEWQRRNSGMVTVKRIYNGQSAANT
jgi:hypothetical protein